MLSGFPFKKNTLLRPYRAAKKQLRRNSRAYSYNIKFLALLISQTFCQRHLNALNKMIGQQKTICCH